jgi:hypothetical protein
MRILPRISGFFLLFSLICAFPSAAQTGLARWSRILSAKTAYFDNQTGSDAVGKGALSQLKKWGKFQIVQDRQHADLIFFLSADPDKGGNVVLSGGQTGSIGSEGHIEEDPIPTYNKQSPTRYAYLTVIKATTGDDLWSEKHLWGGLLTGFNSIGKRLIRDLEKQTRK